MDLDSCVDSISYFAQPHRVRIMQAITSLTAPPFRQNLLQSAIYFICFYPYKCFAQKRFLRPFRQNAYLLKYYSRF